MLGWDIYNNPQHLRNQFTYKYDHEWPSVAQRPLDPDGMLRGKLPKLAEILKNEMELWAASGITTFGSGPYAYTNLQALHLLDQLDHAFAAGHVADSWLGEAAACREVIAGSRRFGRGGGMRADWKKAIVTLQAGQKIDFAEQAS